MIVILATAVSFQCNSGDVKTKVKKNENGAETYFNPFFPLKDGNKWVYVNEAPREETELYKIEISDVIKTDGIKQMKASSFPYLTKEDTEQILKVNSQNEIIVTDYFSSTGVFVPSKSDLKAGYTWNLGIFTGRVSDEPNPVKAETETFENCIYVLMTDGFTFSFEMWYKRDVGIIKWGANRTNPPTLKPYYFVLKEYRLN